MTENLEQVLVAMATKLGVASDHLWSAMLLQAKVTVVFHACVLFIIMVYYIVGFFGLRWLRNNWYDCDKDLCGIAGVIYGCIAVPLFILGLVMFSDLITAAVNPEYWALKELLP